MRRGGKMKEKLSAYGKRAQRYQQEREKALQEAFCVADNDSASDLGEAVKIACLYHQQRYPGADVYSASVLDNSRLKRYEVEVRAAHFSVLLIYLVTKLQTKE